jgi:hypothetical protein
MCNCKEEKASSTARSGAFYGIYYIHSLVRTIDLLSISYCYVIISSLVIRL